ncbi:restriction endonuclease subunit S, partial [Acinetobacter baumannii]
KEQTKIASFLSTVDEKISQLTQKHQLLSQYKQGMMQKLFSQQIRFKADDGSEFGEWEETTLGEIGTFKSGQGFPEQFQGG